MKRILLLCIPVVFMISCNNETGTLNLLEDPGKWKSDEPVALTDGNMILEGEYESFVYHPGIFKTFENFELTAEMMTKPGAQVALLFHTNPRDLDQGYEVIIDNSKVGNWDHLLKTGSLSTIRNVYYNMVSPEEWFTMKVKVSGNHIYISVNGYPVVDYLEPAAPFRPSQIEKRMLGSGTFALKTLFGNSALHIRSMTVESLPEADIKEVSNPEFARQITQLHFRQLPVVDYHVHEKGDLTMPHLIERSATLGINYGIAANCGLKFPIQTNEELLAYLNSIEGLPIFKAMQAEGREWVDMFDPELVRRFDYAFTDAMTWTNNRGVRQRLWMPEETDVGDPQDFMEQLVAQIEKVVTEPIAIYVNPTYLPSEIEDQYEALWTDERIDRVVQALKENGVALEINSRLKLPGSRIVAAAKAAGVKFAMGTNNTNSENLGNLEWSLNVVEEHQLQPSDMFLPGQ